MASIIRRTPSHTFPVSSLQYRGLQVTAEETLREDLGRLTQQPWVCTCVSCEADGKWNSCRHTRRGAAALQLLPEVTHRFYVYIYLVIKSLNKGRVCVDLGNSDQISQTNLTKTWRMSSANGFHHTDTPPQWFRQNVHFSVTVSDKKSPLRALTTQFIRFVFVKWPSAISHYFICKYFTVYVWFFVRHLRAKARAGWI